MWGDRLIDANEISYGEWEASKNETAPAIELIPKDIIKEIRLGCCDSVKIIYPDRRINQYHWLCLP
jgi:hypothetical protein